MQILKQAIYNLERSKLASSDYNFVRIVTHTSKCKLIDFGEVKIWIPNKVVFNFDEQARKIRIVNKFLVDKLEQINAKE